MGGLNFKKARRRSFFITIFCACKKPLKLIRPEYVNFRNSHAHCENCNLEWHLNYEGRIYNHPWKINGVVWHECSVDAKKEFRKMQEAGKENS